MTDLLWTQPQWIAAAQAWIRARLAEAGFAADGPIETLHARAWSTVMRCAAAGASDGAETMYFKACRPLTEPRLTVFLNDIRPENLPDLLAVDLERGWMLMRDAGPMLRTHLQSPGDLTILDPALAQFADLQMALCGQGETLLRLGALDHRLERLPGMFAALLEEPEVLRLGQADGLSEDQHRQLRSILPGFTQMCRELAEAAVPETLQHDDFHDGNIFISGQPGAARFVFSDWGESCLAHPFYSIMLCLRSVASRAGFPDEATEAPEGLPPELNRLRDVYLRPWERYANPQRLVELFNLAWRTGMVSRALSWRAFLLSLDPPDRAPFTYIVPAWLQEFLLSLPVRQAAAQHSG